MNHAARIVIFTLAFVVVAYTLRTVLTPFVGPTLDDKAFQAYNLALGALIGVIGKTAYDAATATPPGKSVPVTVTNDNANPVPTTDQETP